MTIAALWCLVQVAQVGPLPVGRDVWGLALCEGGKTLAISHRTNRLSILTVDSGVVRTGAQAGPDGAMLTELSLSSDAKTLVAGNENPESGANPTWDTDTWKTGVPFGIRTTVESAEASSRARFSGDGRFIFGEHRDSGSLAAFDPATGTPSFQMVPNAAYPMSAWDAAPMDTFVAFVQEDLGIQIWAPVPTATSDRWAEREPRLPLPEPVQLLRFSPDGRTLAVVGGSGEAHRILFVPLEPDQQEITVDLGDLDARAGVWFPDSRRLALAGLAGRIAIVDTVAGRVLHRWLGHEGRHVRAAIVTEEGRLVTGAAGAYSEKEGGQITWWNDQG
ncbi:MAG: hypothetical protein H6534_10130, partial [Chthonomonadaceae bacterium]|nr:hypothetical protein [Chthonomonadaceae bacterium]